MWALLKSLLAKWALFKVLLATLGRLAWLIPVAFILKAVGLPMLTLLLILALPIFIVLAIVGLPFILIAVAGTVLLAGLFFLLSLGIAALKIAIPIVIIVWIVRWFTRDNGSKPTPVDPATE